MKTEPFVVPSHLRSWVPGADDSDFSIQNLPIGVARLPDGTRSLLIRIGDWGLPVHGPETICALSVEGFRGVRQWACEKLAAGSETQDLLRLDEVTMELPCSIPQFTDFYSGIHHASNVGRMFRPDMPPLLPNYRHLPVAYNGRATSVALSGTPVVRPKGQVNTGSEVVFRPTEELDFEAELGFFVASHATPTREIEVDHAEEYMLGLTIVNDWSARDIQRFEYQPLGPFLAKSFLTSISPWVVSLDALEPFRRMGNLQEPTPLPHLASLLPHHFDIEMEVEIQTPRMTSRTTLSRPNAKDLYWSFAQQLAHLTSNGLPCTPGELCASGTISGEDPGSFGSLLEMSWRGTQPLDLGNGEQRTYLQNGDTVTISAACRNSEYRIGLGEIVGTVVAA